MQVHFYILAGGKSRRFGANKALFVMGGKSVVERVIAAIPPGHQIFVITNSPAEYAHLQLPMVPDQYSGAGPLAGIQAGLAHSPHEWNFFLACDLPLLNASIIEKILQAPRNAQVILPETAEGLQPLCALWSQSTLPVVEAALKSRRFSVRTVLTKLSVHRITPSEPAALLNLNGPEDLAKFQAEFPADTSRKHRDSPK
jgi:molybdopterin-guanine dinucleotide biosynthesis protein A